MNKPGLLCGAPKCRVVVAIVLAIAVCAFSVKRAVDNAISSQADNQATTARIIAQALDTRLQRYAIALQILSARQGLAGPGDLAEFHAAAVQAADLLGGWIFVLSGDDDGRVLLHTRVPLGSTKPIHIDAIRAASSSPAFKAGKYAVTDLYQNEQDKQFTIAVGVPISQDNHAAGSVWFAMPASHMTEFLNQSDYSGPRFATLLDGDGRVIARSHGRPGERTGLQAPEWLRDAFADNPTGTVRGIGMSGIDNIFAFRHLTIASQWVLVVGAPLTAFWATMWQSAVWIAAATLAPLGAVGFIIWHRWRIAQEYSQAERRNQMLLERLFRGLPAIVFLCDVRPDGSYRVITSGGDFRRVTGWPRNEFATHEGWDRHRDATAMKPEEAFRETLSAGRMILEYRFRQPDGSWSWVRSELRLLNRRDDGSGEVVGNITNVAARHRMEAQAIAAARLASVGEMARGMSHEFRQPMAALQIASENLKNDLRGIGVENRIDRRIDRIHRQVERMSELVHQLTRFSTGDNFSHAPGRVSWRAAMRRIQDVLTVDMNAAGAQLKILFPPDGDVLVIGYQVSLDTILINLLTNAIESVAQNPPKRPREITMSLDVNRKSNTVEISVSDTGKGISPAIMPRLFEPFVTTKDPDRNSGLGLALCRGLANAMGGTITAHSSDDGATFVVTLVAAAGYADADTQAQQLENR